MADVQEATPRDSRGAQPEPLIIYASKEREGDTYQLHPESQARVQKAYPHPRAFPRIFISRGAGESFAALHSEMLPELIALLTGLRQEELRALGGIEFWDSETEEKLKRWPEQAELPPGVLDRIVEVLAPEEVWFFGSRARGTHRPDSDWDLMAVLSDSVSDDKLDLANVWNELRDLRRMRVEVLPIRRGDFEERRQSLGDIVETVVREGHLIYGR
jgi:uncharacterized protein